MILYHPLFDVYHCLFRILLLLETSNKKEMEKERLRILDFYLLFPHALKSFRFPKHLKSKSKFVNSLKTSYEQFGSSYILFLKLTPFQDSALGHLISTNIINKDKFEIGIIERTSTFLPEEVINSFKKPDIDSNLVSLLSGFFTEINLDGTDGLKARSGLIEFKYDTK